MNHVSLSVTDLDRSEAFYEQVLDFFPLMDFGYARTLVDRPSSFLLALVRQDADTGEPFGEQHTGLDHLVLVAEDRSALEEWERRFAAAGVAYTPIRDLPLGDHLNFRDPDRIPWEFYAPTQVMRAAYDELREREPSREEIEARFRQLTASGG